MSEFLPNFPEPKDHYPYVTRSLLRLYESGALQDVADIDVEPDYGYVSRITYHDGNHRITYGNDLGLNTGASSDLAKDKGHTKFMLETIGVEHPKGEEFLLPWWADKIRPSQAARGNQALRTSDMADAYIQDELGYPVYTKPVDGSKGGDIYKVHSANELGEVMDLYDEKKVRVAIVEEPIDMPDYRVVTLDGELISAYRRIPLTVLGDGESSVRGLLDKLQAQFDAEGRDTRLDADDYRIVTHLQKQGLTVESRLAEGQDLVLVPVSNLSMGGTSEDVTDKIHSHWSDLAAYTAKNFNLRLCGVDLACSDITDSESPYSVIEVNAAPGLDHYAASGDKQKQTVDKLYTRVFNALPNIR
ncbi:MAG TPA: hypothetical protein VK983_04355 [Candidatus Limnocylindrales bacterium]|nr:hypothetical protein [Candidatus Limnocylindrales bacterium]